MFYTNYSCCDASGFLVGWSSTNSLALPSSEHKNPTIKPYVVRDLQHSLCMTFRGQCSHPCSHNVRGEQERWGVRKKIVDTEKKERAKVNSALAFLLNLAFRNQEHCHCEFGGWDVRSSSNSRCVMILFSTAFVSTVFIVCENNHKWRQQLFFAVILCILGRFLLLVIINLLVLHQIEKSSVFVVGWMARVTA